MPLHNDWDSLRILLHQLDAVLHSSQTVARVIVVDDGSTIGCQDYSLEGDYRAVRRVDVLELKRNLGHQRAIAIGLAYIEARVPCRSVVVMDSDGEDAPADVPRLLDRADRDGERRIVFAERARRSESWLFCLFYALFRGLHVVLTGRRVRVGNFSVVPRARLGSLVVVSELWNHYAAAIVCSRQPHCMIPTARAARLAGHSRMDFVRLVAHGLSAISVYGEVIGVRLIVATVATLLLALVGLAGLGIGRIAGVGAPPTWAAAVVGLMLVLLFQALLMCAIFCFLILGGRQGASFLPSRDYVHYVGAVRTLARTRG
jgi:hypothetical protein